MECCLSNWAGPFYYYLSILDKLEKSVCRLFKTKLDPSTEHLAHHQNMVSLPHCHGWFTLLIGWMIFWSPFPDIIRMYMPTIYFLRQYNSEILSPHEVACVSPTKQPVVFVLLTLQPWEKPSPTEPVTPNFLPSECFPFPFLSSECLPPECFPLIYYLNYFKSRVNRNLTSLISL